MEIIKISDTEVKVVNSANVEKVYTKAELEVELEALNSQLGNLLTRQQSKNQQFEQSILPLQNQILGVTQILNVLGT